MAHSYRKYNARKDKKAVQRIWQECGWISEEKREIVALDQFVKCSSGWVFDMDGSAECLSLGTQARFRHTNTDLSLVAIAAVTTSRVARNQRGASGTLARLLAEEAAAGMQLSGLGIFEQGFYDRLGYGNGTYEHSVRFDPAWLADLGKPRVPVRLAAGDWKEIHESRLHRRKRHGAVDLLPPEITKSELEWPKNTFGLGYRENGKLTHYFVAYADDVESGPYKIHWMVYQTIAQFRELMAIIRGLGDQVRLISMREPRDVQLQSLIRKPFQLYQISENAKRQSKASAIAYWQLRMLNVSACVAAVSTTIPLEFNLTLADPIVDLLPDDAPWGGCGGDYTISLGPTSTAVPGHTAGLPLLSASVNDFTRFWMGSADADVLAGIGSFDGSAELIAAMDDSLKLPLPAPDWDY
jgi:hypothetical protein